MTTTIQPFTTSRELAAPRDLVYQVHTQPDHLNRWMGPDGFDSIKSDMDLRAGGTHHYGLQGPGGMQMWGKQEFLQVEPGRKLVYLQSFSDADGGIARHPMAPTWPERMHATTTFEDAGPRQDTRHHCLASARIRRNRHRHLRRCTCRHGARLCRYVDQARDLPGVAAARLSPPGSRVLSS